MGYCLKGLSVKVGDCMHGLVAYLRRVPAVRLGRWSRARRATAVPPAHEHTPQISHFTRQFEVESSCTVGPIRA